MIHASPIAWVLGSALLLRLVGIDFGLPEIYTSDGEFSFVDPAMQILRSRSLHPSFFGHPGSTVIYPFAFLTGLLYAVQYALGTYGSFAEFDSAFRADPTQVYVLLRTWTALLGTAVVGLTYVVARPVFGERAALVGAGLTAIAPYQHEWSRIARTDIPVTLFGLLATGCALKVLSGGRARWYVAAGAAAALALASKFPGGVAVLPLIVAHFARWRRGDAPFLGPMPFLAVATFVLVFFGSSPYLLIDYPTALAHIGAEFEQGHLGADRLPGVWNYLWYLYSALPTAMGPPVWAVALPAGLFAFRRNGAARLVFAAFPLGYMAVIMSATLRWANWVIPAIPFFAVWAGWGIDRLATSAAARWPNHTGARRLFPALVALVAVWPLGIVLAHDYRALLPDTRTEAAVWYRQNLPPGARVAFEHYAGRPPAGVRVDVPGLLGTHPLEHWRDAGYQYLVLSDWMYGRVYAEPEKFGPQIALYDDMFRRGEMLLDLDPCVADCWLGRRGPTIRVLKIT